MNVQIMSVTFEELDSGAPALNICSEFTIPISNKTFIKSFMGFYTTDRKFNIESLTGNKISFHWFSEADDILEFHYKNNFVGYVLGTDMYKACSQILHHMLSEK